MPGCCSARWVFLFAVVGCACALISTPHAAQSQDQTNGDSVTYPVDGVVENSLTHRPIARVLVSGTSDEVLTDNQGRFELHLPAGPMEIRLRRPGYGSGGFMSAMRDTTRRVKVVAGMAPLTLDLTPAASIVAHLTLSSGDEPDGIRFTLYRKQVSNGYAQWVPAGNAVSDSQGEVRFPAVDAPASYIFCSQTSPDRVGLTAPDVPTFGYPTLCFPGGVEFASAVAAPLKLDPAQQAAFDLDLERQPFYAVTISVAGSGQGPAPFVQVHSQTGEQAGFGAVREGRGGPTVLHLPNGRYYAEVTLANGPNGPESRRYARVDFTVAGGPITGLTLVPVPMQPLSVEIRRDFTASASQSGQPGSSVVAPGNLLDDSSPGVNLALVPLDTPMAATMGGNLRHDPSAPNGDFYLWDVSSQGRFRVEVSSFGQYYVSSITSGAADLTREPLVIDEGGSAQPIEIVLRNDMGQLACTYAPPPSSTAGSVANELDPVIVYAIPLYPGIERIPQGIAQLPGRPSFSFPLPPGSYLVVGTLGSQQLDLNDPEVMARLTAAGQKVTIQSGETATVALDKLFGGDETGKSNSASSEANQ